MSTLTCIISAIIVVGIVIVILAIVGEIFDYYLLQPVRNIAWALRLRGVLKRLQAKANALEPQVKTLVERKAREHSLHLKQFLTREEDLRQGGIEIGENPPGWTFLVGKGDMPSRFDIRVTIVLRSEWWDHLEPTLEDWFADRFVFAVGSAHPKSIPQLEPTSSSNVAEIEPLIERILVENGV